MNHVKIILIIVLTLLLGCDEPRPDEVAPPAAVSGADSDVPPEDRGYDYTISAASGGESVYIYYSLENLFPSQDERFFQLGNSECLRMKGEQFKGLSIFASRGTVVGGDKSESAVKLLSEDYTPLCNNMLQCSPNNYAITEKETGFFDGLTGSQEFIIRPVEGNFFKSLRPVEGNFF